MVKKGWWREKGTGTGLCNENKEPNENLQFLRRAGKHYVDTSLRLEEGWRKWGGIRWSCGVKSGITSNDRDEEVSLTKIIRTKSGCYRSSQHNKRGGICAHPIGRGKEGSKFLRETGDATPQVGDGDDRATKKPFNKKGKAPQMT